MYSTHATTAGAPRTPRPSSSTVTMPASARATMNGGHRFNIGDRVTIPPERSEGIIRYLGRLPGMPGEFAGIELIGTSAPRGRHSGVYEGKQYFTVSVPESGVFISVAKLSASAGGAGGPASAVKRMSVPGMRPPSRDGGDILGSPSRIARSNRLSATGIKLQQASLMSPPSLKPASLRSSPDKDSRTSPRGKRLSALHAPVGLSSRPAVSENRQTVTRTDNSAKITALEKALEETKLKLDKKEDQIATLQKLLDECDEQLREMHELAIRKEAELDEERQKHEFEFPRSHNPKLLKMLDEKEKKMDALRQEFDRTVEKLRDDNLETVHHYETKLVRVEGERDAALSKLEKASVELQQFQYMQSMDDKTEDANSSSDLTARARMIRLADVENRLLEREAELREASDKIEALKRNVADSSGARTDDGSHSKQLELELEKERSRSDEHAAEAEVLRARVADLTNEVERLGGELATVSSSHQTGIAETDQESLQLQEQLAKEAVKRKQAEEDLARFKSDHAIALADMGQFKEEIASLKAKLDTQQEQSADLDQVHKAVVDLRLHVEQLEKENADLSATNARLRAQVDQRTATLALQKNHESESLKKELEEERLQVAKLREELETAESMLESKILRETELERALDSLRSLSSPEAPVTPTKGHRFAVDAAEHPGGYSVPEGDVGVYKSPQKIDPAAGRALWCGLCEKEGHESIDCPFSDEF